MSRPITSIDFTLRVTATPATAEAVQELLAEVARRLGGSLGRVDMSDAGTYRRREHHRMIVKR